MEINNIEKYELVDGHLVMDVNYNILTANEQMYRFCGISSSSSLVEVVHQVDIDDFCDVVRNLRDGQETDMVLRMRRADNSNRWMLVHIARFTYKSQTSVLEYFELNVSDILALKKHSNSLRETLVKFRHIMAMENEFFFTYDYKTNVFNINNFIDSEINTIIEMNIYDMIDYMKSEKLVSEDTMEQFDSFFKDMDNGVVSYSSVFKTNLISRNVEYDTLEFKASTIYDGVKPSMGVGSVRNLTDTAKFKNLSTHSHTNGICFSSLDEIKQYCFNNVAFDRKCQLTLVLIHIDNFEEYLSCNKEDAEKIYNTTLYTMKQMVEYRGIIAGLSDHQICIAMKEINNENYLRAFLEALRNQVSWNLRLVNGYENVTFSIGVSRYPQNGKDLNVVYKKLFRAIEIAHERGKNRYIIYREHLHGEL